jgi:hypothetical protein
MGVVLGGRLEEGRALDVRDAGGVECGVDRLGAGDRVGVPSTASVVEGVALRDLGRAAVRRDLPGHGVEAGARAPAGEDARSLAREREGQGRRSHHRLP